MKALRKLADTAGFAAYSVSLAIGSLISFSGALSFITDIPVFTAAIPAVIILTIFGTMTGFLAFYSALMTVRILKGRTS